MYIYLSILEKEKLALGMVYTRRGDFDGHSIDCSNDIAQWYYSYYYNDIEGRGC